MEATDATKGKKNDDGADPIEKLDAYTIGQHYPGKKFLTIEQAIFKGRGIKTLDDIGGCKALRRLDLSSNQLVSYEGLKQVSSLSWVSLAGNQIVQMTGIELLTNLQYLNLSYNKVCVLGLDRFIDREDRGTGRPGRPEGAAAEQQRDRESRGP